MLLTELPTEIKKYLKNSDYTENTIGCSSSKVYYIKNIHNSLNTYLKIAPHTQVSSLSREVEVLKYLKNKLPVPEVICHEIYKDKEYLLMSEIEGLDASNPLLLKEPEKTVEVLAEGLKLLHSIDISDCPFNKSLDIKLAEAKSNIESGLVDINDFQPENIGKSAEEIYYEITKSRTMNEDLVFTHGDYCLPNIIIKNWKLSGFIDIGGGGLADRYQDLALVTRSIKYNMKTEDTAKMIKLFFEKYGIDEIDYKKIDFYILLDELF